MAQPKLIDQELLQAYLRRSALSRSAHAKPITPRPAGGTAPLSLSQEPIFLRSLEPGIPLLYNESVTIHRNGPLDVDALQRSLSEIIRRHEIWRTSFSVSNGLRVQVVRDAENVPLRTHDVRHLPEQLREEEAIRLGEEDSRRPFNLEHEPLVRFRLVRLGVEEFRLFITMHQIVCDGVSVFQVLLTELTALYDAHSSGKPPDLPDLPIQYGDYAHWQRTTLGSELERQLSFWTRQLAGSIRPLPWPIDRPRPDRQTYRGVIQPFTLSKQLSQDVRILASREGVTLFTALVAAVGIVLHGYTAEAEFILGTVSPSGRKRSEVQSLIGYFLNPVCLKLNWSGNPSLGELLRRCYQTLSEAISQDDIPLETLADKLAVPDPSRHPFFTVATSLEPPVAQADRWSLTPMDLQSGGARWDMYVVFDDRPTGIMGRVQYNPDLFEPREITQVVDDMTGVLERMTSERNASLSRLRPARATNSLAA